MMAISTTATAPTSTTSAWPNETVEECCVTLALTTGPSHRDIVVGSSSRGLVAKRVGRVVLRDPRGPESVPVDRYLVDRPLEVVTVRRGKTLDVGPGIELPAALEVVAADAPVAGVGLGRGRRVGADILAVHVAAGRLDGHDLPGIDAEHHLAVVHHVDVTVVVCAHAGLRATEPNQLAARVGGGLEPALDRKHLRVSRRLRGRHQTLTAVEADRGVRAARDRADRAQCGARLVDAVATVWRRVGRGGA